MTDQLAFKVTIKSDFEAVLEAVIDTLKQEGFGVLTRIDVRATMKERLNADFHPYIILGACNPPLAHRALSSDSDIGVMLPYIVTVEQRGDRVLVSLANPEVMLTAGAFAENEELQSVAKEALTRIQSVATRLAQ